MGLILLVRFLLTETLIFDVFLITLSEVIYKPSFFNQSVIKIHSVDFFNRKRILFFIN